MQSHGKSSVFGHVDHQGGVAIGHGGQDEAPLQRVSPGTLSGQPSRRCQNKFIRRAPLHQRDRPKRGRIRSKFSRCKRSKRAKGRRPAPPPSRLIFGAPGIGEGGPVEIGGGGDLVGHGRAQPRDRAAPIDDGAEDIEKQCFDFRHFLSPQRRNDHDACVTLHVATASDAPAHEIVPALFSANNELEKRLGRWAWRRVGS